MDYAAKALELHRQLKGKISVQSKVEITSLEQLSTIYTPGVGAVSSYLADHPEEARELTFKSNSVAVVSDGSAVLGLGNIGPEAALPVMEGKSQLFKHFGNIDAVPIVLSTHDPEQIIAAVEAIAPTFAGINLEDIAAPQCFHIEEELKKRLNIPVMHDDQWGTAVVVLAGLINALKLADKKLSDCRIVLSGAGAAGTAILKLLLDQGATNILMIDRSGIIYRDRPNNTPEKAELAKLTNPDNISGTLQDAMTGADIFIGVSAPNLLSSEDVKLMTQKSIIFALSNPIPEIMPDVAKEAGVFIMATGRSDFPNQVNNALAFPGIFRGAIDHRVTQITIEHLVQAATALANLVSTPDPEKIIPSIFDEGVAEAVSKSIN